MEDLVDIGGCLTDCNDGADSMGLGSHRRQVNALPAAAGNQNERVKRPDRRRCGMRSGRL